MTWKDGGHYGRLARAITDETGSRAICRVWTKQNAEHRGGGIDGSGTEPWPEGEENFALILKAPVLLEALEAVVDKAEQMMQVAGIVTWRAACIALRRDALAAIAAVKGSSDG